MRARRLYASLPSWSWIMHTWLRALTLTMALLCCATPPALAHKPSDSYLSLYVQDRQIVGQWDIALRDLDFAIGLDQDGDGKLTWDEIRQRHAAIAAYALERLTLSTRKGACALQPGEQLIDHHTDGAYSVLRFQATCPAQVSELTIGYRLFADTDPQHKGLLRLTHSDGAGDGAAPVTTTAIFDPQHARQTLSLATPDRWHQFAVYVKEGVWHIWIGYDHILFLLSLLLPAVLLAPPANNLRGAVFDVLKVVTAFTLAHSLTLTLASLSLVSLPSRLVESAIAASVVLAALNNIYPILRTRRPLAAFVFGLIHGFGFASVLSDLGLPQGALFVSLLGFNLGVELGQLAIVAVFLPLAFALRHTRFYRALLTWGSALIAVLAMVWLVERLFDLRLVNT